MASLQITPLQWLPLTSEEGCEAICPVLSSKAVGGHSFKIRRERGRDAYYASLAYRIISNCKTIESAQKAVERWRSKCLMSAFQEGAAHAQE